MLRPAIAPWLIAAAVMIFHLPAGCDSSPAKPRGSAATTAGTPRDPAAIWANTCAQCHRRAEFRGRTIKDIRRALTTVPEMRRVAPLSDDELRGLEQMFSSTPPGASASPRE